MITAGRFIERSTNRDEWLAARTMGVTATEVATAATPAGFRDAVQARLNPEPVEPNEYMMFGTEQEPHLMRYAHTMHGILPSDWLIAAEGEPKHMATPDGLSVDHSLIAECKTTGKDWTKPPVKYMRQVQWQLYVTGADKCLFLWMLRVGGDFGFYPGWLEPKTLWIERDNDMIRDLVVVANKLIGETNGEL